VNVGATLDLALQKLPADRFESAGQMAQALHDCARSIDAGLR
jgi:hypothetical protein